MTVSLNGHATKDVGVSKTESGNLSLPQLLESRFSDFMRKSKHGRGSHVYDLLIAECERSIFTFALEESDGNQTRAAELLGINRNTLSKKIKVFKIATQKRGKKE